MLRLIWYKSNCPSILNVLDSDDGLGIALLTDASLESADLGGDEPRGALAPVHYPRPALRH